MRGQHRGDQIGVRRRPDPALDRVDKVRGQLDGVGEVTVVAQRHLPPGP